MRYSTLRTAHRRVHEDAGGNFTIDVVSISFVLAGLIAAGTAGASSSEPDIGIFADATGTQCIVQQTSSGVGTVYVVATLGGAARDGIKTAEFGVTGFPDDWVVNITPGPAAMTMLWNPVDGGGTIVYESCEAGDGDRVLLATIGYFAPTAPAAGTVLTLTRNTHRVDPGFQCPLVKKCEELPAELRICVSGSDAVLNGESCPTSVEAATWSTLKGLYGVRSSVIPAR